MGTHLGDGFGFGFGGGVYLRRFDFETGMLTTLDGARHERARRIPDDTLGLSPRQVSDVIPNASPRLVRAAGVGIGVALIGAVVTAAATQHRPGPRLTHKDRLVDLIEAEDARARDLRKQLDDLRARLDALEADDAQRVSALAGLQREADALAGYAGTAPVRGPGVHVELRDSPLRTSPSGDPNDLVIHQQDIQAVVNALWAGGAEALTVNGERITATSAIRCVGNTLLLHGNVYSPPYVVEAIGSPDALQNGLATDPLLDVFREAVSDFRLGFTVHTETTLDLPAYVGFVGDRYAEAA